MYSHGHTSTDTLGDVMDEELSEGMPPRQTVAGLPKYHTSREVPQTMHEGTREDCPQCNPPGAAGPDAVGRLLELLDQLETQARVGAKTLNLLDQAAGVHATQIEQLDRIAGKGAEGLENLSLIISQRIHFVELLDRAAALIDPDVAPPTHEQRLDWLAKWREVVGR